MLSGSRLRSVCAILALISTLACSKDNADEHARKGDDYVQRSLLKEAVIEYRTAIQVAPRRGDVRLKLADTLMLQSDASGALREYVRAADLLPKDPAVQIRAGALLLSAGAFEDAKSQADKAIALDPKNATAQVLRGNALAGLRDADAAMSEYQEALALNPRQESAYRNIAMLQLSRGQQAEAEASFRKAVEMAPNSVDARVSFASFLWANNRIAEAEAILKEAQALEPANLSVNRALGMLYVGTNRAEQAEPYFLMIAQVRNTIRASFGLADYYILMKRFDEGRKILNDFKSKSVSHDAADIRLAAIAAAQGNRAQALTTLREVLERRPKEIAARAVVARLLLQDGKKDEALAEATTVVREAPTSSVAADAYLMIGAIHTANDRPGDAIDAYQEVLKRQAQPFAADLALGSLYLSEGNLDKAATYTRQALAIQPKDPSARSLLTRILTAQKNFGGAKEMLTALEKDFPNSAGVLELAGTLQTAQGQPEAARASFVKAGALAPRNLKILTALVRSDLVGGHGEAAVQRVESALKVDVSAGVLLLAAKTYAATGHADKTEDMLLRAIEAEPQRSQPYGLLGALYAGEDRLSEARERFQQGVARHPKSVALNTVLAMVMDLQHQTSAAETQYKNVLAIDPHAAVAANNLAWAYVSSDRNLDEALQLAQTAQQAMPDDPSVNDTLGWVYYKKRMIDQAVRHLELSTQQGPDDPSRHYHLGMAYVQTGNFTKAKKSLERALGFHTDFVGVAEARKALSQVGG